jgi:hypothetical protein
MILMTWGGLVWIWIQSKDSELEDDLVAHVEDPISSSGDEFDD